MKGGEKKYCIDHITSLGLFNDFGPPIVMVISYRRGLLSRIGGNKVLPCKKKDVYSIVIILTAIFFEFLLQQRVPPLRVDDLIEDLKDGVRLIALLEVLANTKLVNSDFS